MKLGSNLKQLLRDRTNSMQISVSRQSNRLRQTNEIVWYPRFIADFYYVLVMKLAAQHYFFVIPNYA